MSMDERMARLESGMDAVGKALDKMADAVTKLAAVETRVAVGEAERRADTGRIAKAEAELAAHAALIAAINAELPTLKLTRAGAGEVVRYVLMAVLGAIVAGVVTHFPK